MRIEAAGIVLQDPKHKILVLHRNADLPEGGKWGLPGGKLIEDLGFLKTAQRKTEDEVAIHIDENRLILLGKFEFSDDAGNEVVFYTWIVNLENPRPEINLNTRSHDRYKWESVRNLIQQNNLMIGMHHILKKVQDHNL